MKYLSAFIIAALIISLAGCFSLPGAGNAAEKAAEKAAEAEQNSGIPDDKSGIQAGVKSEGLDWTINVDDTISGSYELPAGGKTLKYDITLRMVAWKSGGADVRGTYEGEAYILFRFDESGLSDADYHYMGGGAFNRRCERLKFEIGVYDQEKLNQQTIPFPDAVSVAPLRNFNAMASFESVWSAILQMNQTVEGRESGSVLSDMKGEFDEGSDDNMGVVLLIDDEHVTVDIPTYRLTWNCGYFSGTVISEPMGTARQERLEVPDAVIGNPGASDDTAKEESAQTEHGGESMQYPGMPQNELSDEYINNDPNGLSGYDMNGDGVVDAYIDDDGNLKFDLNFDGQFDDLDITDGVEWGQG